MKMEQRECSETLAYKLQTPGKYPEENTQHSEHGKSLKSRILEPVFKHETKDKCYILTSIICFKNAENFMWCIWKIYYK